MKKLIISISGLLIMALVIVVFVNANDAKKDSKKANTELKSAETVLPPCSAACSHSMAEKTAACEPSMCKNTNCVKKDGKCDPATCPESGRDCKAKEGKVCSAASTCKEPCHFKSATLK